MLKKSKNIPEIQQSSNIYRFHSIVLPLSVSKPFSLSMKPPQKISARRQKFFPPIGWCEFTLPWQNVKQTI